MKTIKRMNETDITIEGEMVVISQTNSSYSRCTVEIPVCMWEHFCQIVMAEMEESKVI